MVDREEPRHAPVTPPLPPPVVPASSPFWPEHLVDLFVRPSRFFSGQLALGRTPYVLLVTWAYGVANAIDRIDTELMRAELGRSRPGWEEMGPLIAGSWLGFWVWALTFGAFAGAGLWWIGGWWYRVRLRWSGATAPDKRLSRLLYVYSAFVTAGPTVLLALVQTLSFANYQSAYASQDPWTVLFLVFPFWSIVTGYLGVRTLFDVRAGAARLWFLVLPFALYVVLFGLLATVFRMLAPPV